MVEPSQATPRTAMIWVAKTVASRSATADDGERDQPQHRAAVGEQQQQRDHAGGRQQQPHVGAVEDRGEVGRDGRRAGDLGGDAVGGAARTPARAGRPRRRRWRRRCSPATGTTTRAAVPSFDGTSSAPSRPQLPAWSFRSASCCGRELALVGGVEHDRHRRVVLRAARRAARSPAVLSAPRGSRVGRALLVRALAEHAERQRGEHEATPGSRPTPYAGR